MKRLAAAAAAAVLLLSTGCAGGGSEPEEAICSLGLVDPLPASLYGEATRVKGWLPEVTDADIAGRGAEAIGLVELVYLTEAEVGSVPFLAMLDAVIDLNNACSAAGI